MRAVHVPGFTCICKLEPGQVKRQPPDPTRRVLGYYVACPACGWKTVTLSDEYRIAEEHTLSGIIVTITPEFVCTYCSRTVSLIKNEFATQGQARWNQLGPAPKQPF